MFTGWNKTEIKRDNGEVVNAIAPIIISASRSTDIPAFYSEWFMNRLTNSGYVKWVNPFNQTPQYISFKNTRVIVFWTKNPSPMIPYLKELDDLGINYYFQFTLNDYDNEKFEPNVPKLYDRIKIFKQLSEKIGKEKVIWRFDPLILTSELYVRKLLKKIWYLGNELIDYTNKLVFSFADISVYKKVQNNLIRELPDIFNKSNILNSEFSKEKKEELAEGLRKLLIEWKKRNDNFEIASCSEDIHLEKYNITHNKCIDDDLMIKLFPDDKKLMEFLGYNPNETNLFGIRPNLKDKGQRKYCGCIYSKDIGAYNTCSHLCVYCYANTSNKTVFANKRKHTIYSEGILP